MMSKTYSKKTNKLTTSLSSLSKKHLNKISTIINQIINKKIKLLRICSKSNSKIMKKRNNKNLCHNLIFRLLLLPNLNQIIQLLFLKPS